MITAVYKHFFNRTARPVKIIALAGILVLAGSCNDFLDETPDNRVELADLEKAAQLLTNAYSVASPAFTDWMTDDVGYTLGTTKRPSHERIYAWEDDTSDPTEQDSPAYFWFNTYEAIAHANEVLAVLQDLPAKTEEEKARKKAIESEALLTRAYGHFMLVNLFGKHYDEETAATDLGVPYIETPETVFLATYERNTVQEVYDKVERDMLKGIELLDDSFFANSGKYHFNKNAALAFASRFYLFSGKYQECVQYSSLMLGSDPSVFVRDLTSTEFQEASSSVTGYPQLYSSPDLPSNLLLMRKISLVQRNDFAYGPIDNSYSQLFNLNMFGSTTDQRENPAFVKGENSVFPVRYQSLFERSSLNSNTGLPYHIATSFRGEEVLLNRAEAYIFLNRVDLAIADLQVLTDARYSLDNENADRTITIERIRSFIGIFNNDRFATYIYIVDLERRKEFIMQGMRWFDIKRLGIEVNHTLQDQISTITLEQDDLRKVLQIPKTAIEVGGLKPNPR
jgi:hypothetical protein